MTNYDKFSKHYDEVIGDRSKEAEKIKKLIKEFNPKAKTILELACGTGAILEYFTKEYTVSGLDLSKGMITVARREIPSGEFFHQDMTNFKLEKKFDVILCLFDSINHLLKFSDWQKVFKNSYKHLNDGGVLIFDINTEFKLQQSTGSQPWVKEFNKNVIIMDVVDFGKNIFN